MLCGGEVMEEMWMEMGVEYLDEFVSVGTLFEIEWCVYEWCVVDVMLEIVFECEKIGLVVVEKFVGVLVFVGVVLGW